MHTYAVTYGNKITYVYACNEEEAIDAAYTKIGYDPGCDLFAEMVERDPDLDYGDEVDEAYDRYQQDIADGTW